MRRTRDYDEKQKKTAVDLAVKIGITKAAKELGIPYGTLFPWIKKSRGEDPYPSYTKRKARLLANGSKSSAGITIHMPNNSSREELFKQILEMNNKILGQII